MQKSVKLFFFILLTFFLSACSQKKTTRFDDFNNLYLLYASPKDEGYLPLKMFSENDSLFVQYLKNGKALEKIQLVYSHSKKEENGEKEILYFDEIIDGEKTDAIYTIPYFLFDTLGYLGETNYGLISYQNSTELVEYYVEWAIAKKYQDIKIDEEDYEEDYGYSKMYYYVNYEKPIYDFLFSIYNNPQSIEMPEESFHINNICTSCDGNLRIYNALFHLGGTGLGSSHPLEIVQFKDGNSVSAFGIIDWKYEQIQLQNFIYFESIKIHTISLNNKTYYLIDRAMCDLKPIKYTDGNVLKIYAIENGELVQKRLFNTNKKIIDEIAVEYCDEIDYTIDENSIENKVWNLFKYDDITKTIYVPLVKGVELTDQYLLYQWDGDYFTYKGVLPIFKSDK